MPHRAELIPIAVTGGLGTRILVPANRSKPLAPPVHQSIPVTQASCLLAWHRQTAERLGRHEP